MTWPSNLETGAESHRTFASYIQDKSFPVVGVLAFNPATKKLAVSSGQKHEIHLWEMPFGTRTGRSAFGLWTLDKRYFPYAAIAARCSAWSSARMAVG